MFDYHSVVIRCFSTSNVPRSSMKQSGWCMLIQWEWRMIVYYIGSGSDVGMPELSGGLSNVRHTICQRVLPTPWFSTVDVWCVGICRRACVFLASVLTTPPSQAETSIWRTWVWMQLGNRSLVRRNPIRDAMANFGSLSLLWHKDCDRIHKQRRGRSHEMLSCWFGERWVPR